VKETITNAFREWESLQSVPVQAVSDVLVPSSAVIFTENTIKAIRPKQIVNPIAQSVLKQFKKAVVLVSIPIMIATSTPVPTMATSYMSPTATQRIEIPSDIAIGSMPSTLTETGVTTQTSFDTIAQPIPETVQSNISQEQVLTAPISSTVGVEMPSAINQTQYAEQGTISAINAPNPITVENVNNAIRQIVVSQDINITDTQLQQVQQSVINQINNINTQQLTQEQLDTVINQVVNQVVKGVTVPAPIPVPIQAPVAVTIPAPIPIPVTEQIDINKPEPIKPIPPSSGDDEDVEEYKKKLEFSGAVTWRQGAFYKAWKYPYMDREDLATFKEPPPNAVMVDGGGTPQETLQLMGKTPPPPDRIVDMGVVEFHIETDADGKLRIKYNENKEVTEGDAWFSDGVPMKHRKAKHKSSKSSGYVAPDRDNWIMSSA
jgi:hypothetical protein